MFSAFYEPKILFWCNIWFCKRWLIMSIFALWLFINQIYESCGGSECFGACCRKSKHGRCRGTKWQSWKLNIQTVLLFFFVIVNSSLGIKLIYLTTSYFCVRILNMYHHFDNYVYISCLPKARYNLLLKAPLTSNLTFCVRWCVR